jgi:uncharacterized membrane protein
MASLVVFKFETAEGAGQALDLVKSLQAQYMLELIDASTISWPVGDKKPRTRQLVPVVGADALDGAFWGMLFGVIFFVPLFGAALGAAMGALAGKFADYGIDDRFIKEIRENVTEGTSAIFLLTGASTTDKVIEALKQLPKFELISSNLTGEQEAKLREIFA